MTEDMVQAHHAGHITWTAHTGIYNCSTAWNTACLTGTGKPAQLPREQHSLVKVTVCKNQRSNQSPDVQHDADPAGRDLHPDRWPLAGHCLVGRIRAVRKGK